MADAALARSPQPELLDQRVHLSGLTWEDYERLLELRGDDPTVRLTYLEGQLEIMTPSTYHERLKTRLARLLEAWSEETGVDLEGAGSWTLRDRLKERGLEPDECYFIGRTGENEAAPDFALEEEASTSSTCTRGWACARCGSGAMAASLSMRSGTSATRPSLEANCCPGTILSRSRA